MMAELDQKASCQVIMMDAKLLMVKSGDDSAKLWCQSACSCGPSGVYESAASGCKVTNIIARWVHAMES